MNNYQMAIKYGSYGAILGLVFYFVLLFSGNSPWSGASWLGCWIPGVSAFFCIKALQKDSISEVTSFKEIFTISAVVMISQAIFYNLLVFLFGSVIDNNAVEIHKEELMMAAEQVRELLGDSMYYQLEEEVDATSLPKLLLGDFINKVIGGVLIALLLAGVMKRKKEEFEA